MKNRTKWLYGIISFLIALFTGACTQPCCVWELADMDVTTPPSKTVYHVGESLNLTGLVVTGRFDDGSTVEIPYPHRSLSFRGLDNAAATGGQKTITVIYGKKSAVFTLTVNTEGSPSRILESIALTAPPIKTAYHVGESLDLTGLVITASYNDSSTEPITHDKLTISSLDSSVAGQKTIAVTYGCGSADFSVTVYPSSFITLDEGDLAIKDEGNKIFNITQPLSLSKSGGDGALSETVAFTSPGCTVESWQVGNINLGKGDAVTLKAGNFKIGTYTLTLEFTKDNKRWMASLDFTVKE